jgi:hypothetical protein
MHSFKIVTTDGRDLGTMQFARPDWPDGSVIYRGGAGLNLRVVGYRDAHEDGRPVLVVEELTPPRSRT